LRYEVALLGAGRDREERAVTQLCLGLNVASCGIALTICAAIGKYAPGTLGFSATESALLAAGILAGGLYQTFGYVLLRHQALRLNALSKVVQVVVYGLGALLAALIGTAQWGLVGADVLGRFAAAALIAAGLARGGWTFLRGFSIGDLWDAAVKFRHYPLFTVTGGLLSAAASSVAPLFMVAAYGASIMGQYSLVVLVIFAPAAMIGASVAQAFTAQLSSLVIAGEDAVPLFWKVVSIMGLIGLVPALFLLFFGPWAFALVFGAQWTMAGRMAAIVAIFVVSTFAVQPVNMTLLVTARQKQQLTWEISRLLLVIAAWTVITLFSIDPIFAIGIHVGVLVVMSIVFLWIAHHAICAARNRSASNLGPLEHATPIDA
jgi:O-antigen/teichoic acid export membrane protein